MNPDHTELLSHHWCPHSLPLQFSSPGSYPYPLPSPSSPPPPSPHSLLLPSSPSAFLSPFSLSQTLVSPSLCPLLSQLDSHFSSLPSSLPSYLLPLSEVGKKHHPTAIHKLRLLYPHVLRWRHKNDWTVVGVGLFQPYRYGYVVLVAWRRETELVTMVINRKPCTTNYRIAGNFPGRKLHEFRGFVVICESFLCEIWRRGVLWRGTSAQSAKVFSAKIMFFTKNRHKHQMFTQVIKYATSWYVPITPHQESESCYIVTCASKIS